MLTYPIDSSSHRHSFFIEAMQFIASGKKNLLSFFIKAFLLACLLSPATTHAQQGGCINADTIFVPANTVPPTINATPATFTCAGSYTYQWLVSSDNSHFTPIAGATGQNLSYTLPITSPLIFLRQAKCGAITMYTNRVVVIPIYTACTGFGLTLNGTSGNNLASIKAGVVTTTTSSTIGEYVIEWYKDAVTGSPKFTSGSPGATDPAVTVSHPFAGEPAEGGTWHPVIKYIYVDGIKYSRLYTSGARYSPDLTHCLDTVIVTVNNLSCLNGADVYGSLYYSPKYSHRITYNNTVQSSTLASRSFRFDLDANNKYFAWYFAGAEVRDKIKITYKSPVNGTNQQIEYYEIGSGAGSGYHNQTTNPKIYQQVYFWKISSLTQFVFAAGDYLQIDIQPNATFSNTNWEFMCKCFTTVDCNIWDSNMRNIVQGSVGMTWNASTCAYEVTYQRPNIWTSANQSASILWQYNYNEGYSPVDPQVKLSLYQRTYGSWGGVGEFWNCAPLSLSGEATFSRTGNVLSVSCTNQADYLYYKNAYNTTIGAANMNNYDGNNTLLNHYKFLIFVWRKAESCGDAYTSRYYYFHRSSPVVFNDNNLSFTITLTNTTNGYPTSTDNCNSVKTALNGYIDATASSIGQGPVAPETSKVRADSNPFYGIYAVTGTEQTTDASFYTYTYFPDVDICDLSTKGWTSQQMPYFKYEFTLTRDRVKITNPALPLTNWKLQRQINSQGIFLGYNENDWITVYEIQNGNVIVNNGFPN